MKRSLVIAGLIAALAASALEVKTNSPHPAVKNASAELIKYAEKMGASDDKSKFLLSVEPGLKTEEWKIQSMKDGVRLSGGSPRGVLYAVWHYLEDVCGVRWWTPHAEKVPALKTLPVKNLDLAGKPAFEYRGVFGVYAKDRGRYASRMRMNDEHNDLNRFGVEWGGTLFFGPPAFVHTYALYVPESCFEKHPEWFSLYRGKRLKGKGRGSDSSQRCLSNKELRNEFKRRLREFIKKGEADAARYGIEKPQVYVISQNDGSRWCECAECQAIIKRTGGLSGLTIDFVNEIARDIAQDYPHVLIKTSAYNKTEDPPKYIKPEKNVLVDLAHMKYNGAFGLNPKDNPESWQLQEGWSKLTGNLLIWHYNINYREYNELPYPSEYHYADTLRLYRSQKVWGVFAEMESPLHSDVREFKLYLWLKLLENPDLDFMKLRREFADNYYGPAGTLFLKYRDLIKAASDKARPSVAFTPTPDNYTHLDIDTMTAAAGIFAEGEKLLKDDPVLLRRWRDAKISLVRAALFRSKILRRQYLAKHGSLAGYPFPCDRIAQELRDALEHRLKLYPAVNAAVERRELENNLRRSNRDFGEKELRKPVRFKHVADERLRDFTMENSSRFRNFAELVDDPESEVGFAARMLLKYEKDPLVDNHVSTYKLPLVFGVSERSSKGDNLRGRIRKEDVKKAGYNWYKLGHTRVHSDSYVFCFPTWLIQQAIGIADDAKTPQQRWEVWVSVKFTGPEYPFGKKEDPNAVWVDRVLLIREKK